MNGVGTLKNIIMMQAGCGKDSYVFLFMNYLVINLRLQVKIFKEIKKAVPFQALP
jgi:hypothetical protein